MTERSMLPAASATAPEGPGPAARRLTTAKTVVVLAAIVAVALLGRQAGAQLGPFTHWVQAQGAWGAVAFVAAYALAAVAFVPGSVLTLAAGAIFGLVEGTLLVAVAATLGASASFLIARHLARGAIERRLAGNPRFAAIDRAVGTQGRKIVFLLRLSPVFPFNLLNYGLGLTRVRFLDYLIASVGMLPGTVLYVYYGKVAGDVAMAAGGSAPQRGAAGWAVLGVGLLATVAVTAVVTRLARRALREATGEKEG